MWVITLTVTQERLSTIAEYWGVTDQGCQEMWRELWRILRDNSVTSVKMFKWKVSGLGGKKDKSKSQQQQTRLNNEPQQAQEVVEVKNNNNNNKTKDSGKKEK